MPARWIQQGLRHPGCKPVVWLLCLAPAGWLLYGLLLGDGLGANPIEALLRATGDWALRGLCIVLALTPLQVVAGWTGLARLRRLLGLFVFFYALLHALIYSALDMGWDWQAIWADIVQRWFILAGVAAWCILAVLAVTSWQTLQRALGGRVWKRIHQSVHVAAWLAVLHFYWMRSGKNNFAEVWVYAGIFAVLQLWRLWRKLRSRKATSVD